VGGVVLGGGLVLLAFGYEHKAPVIIVGTVATPVGLLLLAPLAIAALAGIGGHFPIAVRLAVRDLGRYQARSGAALGAVTLAVGIAATIAVSAAAAQAPPQVANLPTNQVNIYIGSAGAGPGNGVTLLSPTQLATVQTDVDQLAHALHAPAPLLLEAAVNPGGQPQPALPGLGDQSGGQPAASMAQVTTQGQNGVSVRLFAELYVATPALLAHYGIASSQINSTADVVTSRGDVKGLQIFLPDFPGDQSGPPKARPQTPTWAAQPAIQTVGRLPSYTSDPNVLITDKAVQALGLQPVPAAWLIEAPAPLTKTEIAEARNVAASAGLAIETTSVQKSLAPLRNWSTAAGILVALGVLAMTVGLIRSETAGDLRTLSATGASSATRRTLTAATAGALALLGALLGTGGAYAALVAWHRNDLHPLTRVPVVNLVIIVVLLPFIAASVGWLLAGREPPAIGRQPLE
jgi:putative ABC transport system permease protein